MPALVLSEYRRLVVKVGSSLLVGANGELNRSWLESLAADIAALKRDGHEILIVSSGAIAIGCSALQINKPRAKLEALQAAAAVGQIQLMQTYQDILSQHKLTAAQVLMTLGDTEDRRRFLNARGTFGELLERSVVPIVNENDTVATTEIRYGDNDRLAARIAQLVMADALILLSDVDGLYTADPASNKRADHIPEVMHIGDETLAMAGESRSDYGSGGMATKIQAARIATHAGCSTIIASGIAEHPLKALLEGARCTVLHASGSPAAARKQWLAGTLEAVGELILDDGAVTALGEGNSLLPVGVTAVNGEFRRGDVIILRNQAGVEIGRGLAEYSNVEASQLAGCQSAQIQERIGYRGRSVVVHRDELVLLKYED
jgi:glutamate 5-kinase